MQVFVIRHAIAEEPSPNVDDADRELTKQGLRALKQVVRGLRGLEITVDRVLTSPWARAVGTATRLRRLGAGPPIVTTLLTQPPCAELLAMIAVGDQNTAIVGHEPWLGELVAWLAFGDTRHGAGLQLKKAGLVWLDGTVIPGGMTMRAMLPPKFVRAP